MKTEKFRLHIRLGSAPLPYWFEYPDFLWGKDVNFDSDGDAYCPANWSHWSELDIEHRGTEERLCVIFDRVDKDGFRIFAVSGESRNSVRLAAYLTAWRSGGSVVDPETGSEIPLADIYGSVRDIEDRIAVAEEVRAASDRGQRGRSLS